MTIEGDNKWVTLIQNAAKARVENKAKRTQRSGGKKRRNPRKPQKEKKPEKAGHVKYPEPPRRIWSSSATLTAGTLPTIRDGATKTAARRTRWPTSWPGETAMNGSLPEPCALTSPTALGNKCSSDSNDGPVSTSTPGQFADAPRQPWGFAYGVNILLHGCI